ncbi:MAG TPA: BON domain-containing protein [Planosporangium sp.]|jgi:osmotically-inducible protein OsmY|nr:BON domain-containing protein [Planosporangium sp.]
MTTATLTRSDEEIQRDVLDELKWDCRLEPNEIDVAVKDGGVIVTGWVDSYLKKCAAESAAQRVRGVKSVVNNIEVRLPCSAERTNADLAAEAMRTLMWDTQIPTENLEVTASKGWVSLRGDVQWDHERRAAEQVIRRLAGVRGVNNLIKVQPWTKPSAEELKRKIKEALVRNVETDADRINVHVDGSKVTLTGTLRACSEKEMAELVAWLAPGITSVDNRIVVNLGDDD